MNILIDQEIDDKIPVIDFTNYYGSNRKKIMQEIAEACKTWGFFQLINHGFDQTLVDKMFEVTWEFFNLPQEEKLKIRVVPESICGWSHPSLGGTVGGSKLASSAEYYHNQFVPRSKEYKELFLVRDVVPRQPSAFGTTLAAYMKEILDLQNHVLGLMSEGLGLPPETLEKHLKGPHGIARHSIRFNHFVPSGPDQKGLECPSHSDPTGLTALTTNASGLQVLRNDKWVKVDHIPRAIIFNVGDQIQIFSNGMYKSVNHKGTPAHDQVRLSLAVFHMCDEDTVVGPLQELVDESRPAMYEARTSKGYIQNFVEKGYVGKNLLKDVERIDNGAL